MEAYCDTNGNGVPEADLEEIEYFFLVNSSVTFTPIPVQKVIIENISHYIWGIKYGGVDGVLLYTEDQSINGIYTNLAARVNITSLEFAYDYYIQGNFSYLKTGFKIGRIIDFEPHAPIVSLEGLGLSLLYGTAMLTQNPYAVLVNGEPYNSKSAEAPTTLTDRAVVVIEDKKLYEFIFEENYTLNRNTSPTIHRSESAASPIESVPLNAAVYLSSYWLMNSLLRLLSEDVFPKLSSSLSKIDIEYTNSSFIYRVCYSIWDGWGIEHDPTYVAYLVPVKTNKPIPVGPPIKPPHEPSSGPSVGVPSGFSIETIISVAVAVAGIFALVWALIELRRTMHFSKINPLIKYFK
ncbi:MAG: hypothetical protein QXX08_05070 [Candidatus Bathyarchaeia archaeon]